MTTPKQVPAVVTKDKLRSVSDPQVIALAERILAGDVTDSRNETLPKDKSLGDYWNDRIGFAFWLAQKFYYGIEAPAPPAIAPERERLWREYASHVSSDCKCRHTKTCTEKMMAAIEALGRNPEDGSWSEPAPEHEYEAAKQAYAAGLGASEWEAFMPSPKPGRVPVEDLNKILGMASEYGDRESSKGNDVDWDVFQRARAWLSSQPAEEPSAEVREAMSWITVCTGIVDQLDSERGDVGNIKRTKAALATIRRALGLEKP